MANETKNMCEINLRAKLKEIFGFDNFKGDQEAIIKSLLEGNDTFVIMPTGGGKSMCYQLPAMLLRGTAVVVSPLIALMKNQVDAVRYNTGIDRTAHFLNSSLNKQQAMEVKLDLLDGKTKLLYIAPETLSKEEIIDFLQQIHISFFAIDEAHCISEWGHDFRPEYRNLRKAINTIYPQDNSTSAKSKKEAIKRIPILTLTASATPKVQHDIVKNLQMENAKHFVSSFNRPNLYYEVRPKPSDPKLLHKEVVKFIKENSGKSGIIYCLTRKRVEDLAELLQANDIRALPYHAGMETSIRTANQDKFLNEDAEVIVATIAFGMGIDKPDVRFVIHYDIPKSLEGYYQETGRAGRDGGEAKCIAFYSEHDVERLYRFFSDKNITEQEQAMQLVNEMVSYAETSACRRKALLKYFGEDYPEENCGCCDNCLHPKPRYEAKEEMRLALETIVAMKQGFKAKDIVDVLVGENTSQTKLYRHDQLEQFGQGSDHDELYWKAVLRQGVFDNLLYKVVEQYGILQLTNAGYDFINNPYDIMVSCDHDYTESANNDDDDLLGDAASGDAAGDEILYAILKDLLKDMAKRADLPPYVIFEDRSLKDMTIQYPCNIEEMSHCTGVGVNKAQKYGQQFAHLIKQYVEDNEIERPQDIIVRGTGSQKSTKNKIYIIKSLDRRMSFEDIARGIGLKMDDLLSLMEDIISSGTKLNVDYYIDEFVDPDHMDDLMNYWQESESPSLQDAYEEFADEPDYTEDEIRLSRIKFLSDVGH